MSDPKSWRLVELPEGDFAVLDGEKIRRKSKRREDCAAYIAFAIKPRRYRYRAPRVQTNFEATAVEYARWIARRDGISILTGPGSYYKAHRVEWGYVESATKSRTQRSWNGETRIVPMYEKRVRAVEWGHDEERFNERKDRRRGAWSHTEFVPELRIELPHWDFNPPHPTLETIAPDHPILSKIAA